MLAAYLKFQNPFKQLHPSDGLFGDEKQTEAQLGAYL
jgi:hypothetical protein